MDNIFFTLSKLSWIILSPGNLIIFLFILGTLLVIFKWLGLARWVLIPNALLAGLVLAYPVGDWLIQPLESRFEQPAELPQNIDGIIVLGGGEDLKRSLSWNVAELGLGGDRFIAAKKLADLYPDSPIIFTGGSGSIQLQNQGSEGEVAAQVFNDMGLNPSRLVLENASRNTYENFKNIKPLLEANGQYILVTSAFHMPRSMGIAHKQGIQVTPYPVDYRSNSKELRQIDFDFFDHLKALEPGWKEWIGLTVYYWTGKTSDWWPEAEKD
ncbi:YdcF family protein [Thiomicrospira microaerophila]|uniref:YdcF family protein n=1 Tax=Thiomicrospira microaerophila TaxID=406020 RepID=UPI00200E3726|nr:YdcF family protein [Thiomicrospira microaerophila]UQB43061.1 YdcF family protein [Thiomicrospira microaerophila]